MKLTKMRIYCIMEAIKIIMISGGKIPERSILTGGYFYG